MKKYQVLIESKVIESYEVLAKNEEDAKDKVMEFGWINNYNIIHTRTESDEYKVLDVQRTRTKN